MAEKRKILIISYLFPPAGGIAVQRALSFAKYLPQSGYEVHVLAARNAAAPVSDPGLLKHLPPEVSIHRVFTPNIPFELRRKLWSVVSGFGRRRQSPDSGAAQPSARRRGPLGTLIQRILCPDPEVVWSPLAIRSASKLIRKHSITHVLVTVPPFSVLLIGNALKRRFPNLTLISDFRDEWLHFYLTAFDFHQSEYIQKRAAEIERRTVIGSDLVISVTQSIVNQIRARYPDQPASKFAFLPNGYDPEAFLNFWARPHERGKVVVTHMGTLYNASSPRYYLDALDSLPDSLRQRFETRFIGRVSEEERKALESRQSDVRVLGFMPQTEAFRAVEETDFLLVTMTDGPSLTGKLFEYLATGKPILAISPLNGEIDTILKKTGAGWCAGPDDPAAIRSMLEHACRAAVDGGAALTVDQEEIRQYERPRLTAQLAGLIERAANRGVAAAKSSNE